MNSQYIVHFNEFMDSYSFSFVIYISEQEVLKDLKVLYNESRSNSCIEHALGIMELEKAPEKLSEKISTMSLTAKEMKVRYCLISLILNSLLNFKFTKMTDVS